MAGQNKIPLTEVLQLREQGLTDNLVAEELRRRGYSQQQISVAISEADVSLENSAPAYPTNYERTMPEHSRSSGDDALYERMEETVESMIDEKWDDLIAEVKKIVEWKEKMEDTQNRLVSDVEKLKDDFKLLHQGVLGKLEDYDNRMRDVDTELKAVGKVFKDVIPEFVENVKELSSITKTIKSK